MLRNLRSQLTALHLCCGRTHMRIITSGSDESTREFIQLRYKLRHLFNGRKHQCEKAYSRIVDDLGLKNVISPAQARKKWSNLLQKYMDIKGGYSTANPDWPYFQILDQIVPLMRKEKIEKLSPSTVDPRELDTPQDNLPSPITSPTEGEQDPLSLTSGQTASMGDSKCKTEVIETGEPPRKRGRGRRAAQRARDRWWGAVEDSDLGPDSTGGGGSRAELAAQTMPHKSAVDTLEPSQMELQTFSMLESCSSALVEIKEILRSHTEKQENFMKSVQEMVGNQSTTMKELLATVSSQNTTLIAFITQLTTAKNTHPALGMSSGSGSSFSDQKLRGEQHGTHQDSQQLLTAQPNLISALSQPSQECENTLVETSELTNSITGL